MKNTPASLSPALNDLSLSQDFLDMTLTAIDLCRSENWAVGLPRLRYVFKYRSGDEPLPGAFYSCLGYGLARHERQYQKGLELCKIGVEVSEFEAEPYLYLARTYMLFGRKKPAIDALDRGLRVDPENAKLVQMRREFGWRQSTALSSLPRGHFVNRVSGELRTLVVRKKK